MPQQDFQAFATAANANVLSQSDYLASNWLPSGFSQGIAYSNQVNKVLRQASIISTVIAQAITDVLGVPVIDDGTIATIEANFLALFHTQSRFYAADTGNVNSMVINLPQNPGALSALTGTPLIIKVAHTNTGSTTLNVNGLGALNVVNPDGSALTAGQLVLNGLANILYDGTAYELVSTVTGPLTLKVNEWTQPQTWDANGTFKGSIAIAGSATASSLVSTGGISAAAGAVVTGYDANGAQLRTIGGNYGAFARNDGTNFYLLQTASGNQYGTFNNFRPFSWNFTTGAVTIDASGAGVAMGGALSAGPITASGNVTSAGSVSAGAAVNATSTLRAITGNYGAMLFNDGNLGYLIGSVSGTPTGGFSGFRPFYWNLATGAIGIDGTGAGIATGGGLGVAGAITAGSSIGANGPISSVGNITANLGRVRATYGAFGSGDPNSAAILNDWLYQFTNTAGNVTGFSRQPNGYIQQVIYQLIPIGGGLLTTNLTLPLAFPTVCISATVCFPGNLPPGPNNPGSISCAPVSTTQVSVTTNYNLTGTLGVVVHAFGY